MRLLVSLLLLVAPVAADVELAGIFGDGMVLQRRQPVPIWGRAEPGETVTVRFAGQSVEAIAGDLGRWEARLAPMEVLIDRELVVRGTNEIKLQNVCVGEVWLASGQSNMAWPVRASKDAEREIAAAGDRWLRLFTVPHRVSGEPVDDLRGS